MVLLHCMLNPTDVDTESYYLVLKLCLYNYVLSMWHVYFWGANKDCSLIDYAVYDCLVYSKWISWKTLTCPTWIVMQMSFCNFNYKSFKTGFLQFLHRTRCMHLVFSLSHAGLHIGHSSLFISSVSVSSQDISMHLSSLWSPLFLVLSGIQLITWLALLSLSIWTTYPIHFNLLSLKMLSISSFPIHSSCGFILVS